MNNSVSDFYLDIYFKIRETSFLKFTNEISSLVSLHSVTEEASKNKMHKTKK